MLHQDWVMRQIEQLVAFLLHFFTGKLVDIEDIKSEALHTNDLYEKLCRLAAQGKLCEAEDYLYEVADGADKSALTAGLLFYSDLNKLSDSELESGDFSRREIFDGIHDLCRLYSIDTAELPLLDDELTL